MLNIKRISILVAALVVVTCFATVSSALAAGISVQPASGSPDSSFVITANGFNANESVAIYITQSNVATFGPFVVNATSQGAIQYSLNVPSNAPAGTYSIIAQGQTSRRSYSTNFSVTATQAAASTSITLAPAGMSVQPTSGSYDTIFTLTAGGFNPGEPVSLWVTSPNLVTINPQTLIADSLGAIQVSGQVPSNSVAGKYIAYAQGRYSGHTYSASFTLVAPTYPDWKGEYFNNQTLSGSPVLVRNDTALNFDWGLGSPASSIPSDNFSVRWTRNQYFAAGTYQFTATTDDGMRVWVGNTLLIDTWYDQSATHTANITLAAGTYALRVEYYEDTGNAVAQVSWANATSTVQAWTGSYYNNTSLSGSPAMIRTDAQLNFNWGLGSPSPAIQADDFSAKWDSTQYAPYSGYYTVYATADDGVRVWVDGNLVIDEWQDQFATTYSATGYLNAGSHTVHVEYYEHAGAAMIQVQLVAD